MRMLMDGAVVVAHKPIGTRSSRTQPLRNQHCMKIMLLLLMAITLMATFLTQQTPMLIQ